MYTCGVCCKIFASAERDLTRFSDGTITHRGNCEKQYWMMNAAMKISLTAQLVEMSLGRPVVVNIRRYVVTQYAAASPPA